MRALLIDHDGIRALCAFASKHRIDEASMLDMAEGRMEPLGTNPNYVLHIHFGFRCVFGIEWQAKENCWFRHLSVTVDAPGMAPNPAAVFMLGLEFGFKMEEPHLFYMDEHHDETSSIEWCSANLMQPMKEEP